MLPTKIPRGHRLLSQLLIATAKNPGFPNGMPATFFPDDPRGSFVSIESLALPCSSEVMLVFVSNDDGLHTEVVYNPSDCAAEYAKCMELGIPALWCDCMVMFKMTGSGEISPGPFFIDGHPLTKRIRQGLALQQLMPNTDFVAMLWREIEKAGGTASLERMMREHVRRFACN